MASTELHQTLILHCTATDSLQHFPGAVFKQPMSALHALRRIPRRDVVACVKKAISLHLNFRGLDFVQPSSSTVGCKGHFDLFGCVSRCCLHGTSVTAATGAQFLHLLARPGDARDGPASQSVLCFGPWPCGRLSL
jgi:hypothetical protein